MPDDGESRWRAFFECRDSVCATLAPALPLGHLLKHGRRIAKKLRSTPRRRTLQISEEAVFFDRLLG